MSSLFSNNTGCVRVKNDFENTEVDVILSRLEFVYSILCMESSGMLESASVSIQTRSTKLNFLQKAFGQA